MKNQTVFTRNILLLLAASFFYMASPMLVTPLVTGFSESLGAGAFIMGIVGGLTNLCALVFQPFAGGFADRSSKYRLGCLGTICLVAACAGYAISFNPAMILCFRVLNGLGFSLCSVSFSTWIANLLPRDRVGFGMGLYGMMNALAMAVSPAIGVSVYHRFGYRPAFCTASLFAALCLTMIQFCSNQGLPSAAGGTADRKKLRLIEPKVIPFALVIMCFSVPYCATQSFIVRYAEARGLHVTVSLFFTFYAAALLITRLALRNLFDRVNFATFLAAGSVCALASLHFLSVMNSNLQMAFAAFFMAGGYGLMCTVAQSAAVTSVGPEKRGVANGTYYIGLNSGMALGPMLVGVLYGNTPLAYFYPILMVSVPVCIALYFISSAALRAGNRN